MNESGDLMSGKEYKRYLTWKICEDPSSLNDRQILEILLSYVYSSDEYVKKTDELLSCLLDKKAALDPNVLFLLSPKNNFKAKAFFKILSETSAPSVESEGKMNFSDYRFAGEFFSKQIGNDVIESLCVAYLDEEKSLIKIRKMSFGAVHRVLADIKAITNEALLVGASYVVAAHNHPSKSLIRSNNDFNITYILKSELNLIGVELLEHYVVIPDEYSGTINQFCSVNENGK